MVKLFVDYREKKIISDLSTFFPDMQITRLPVGDVIIIKKTNPFWNRFYELGIEDTAIIIERKSMADFISSIRSGRIWDQMNRISNLDHLNGIRVQHRILAVHGTFEDYFAQIPDYQISDEIKGDGFWRFITKSMTDVILKYGIPIIMLNNRNQFIELIKYLASTNLDFINTYVIKRRTSQNKRIKSTGKDLQIDMLCSIPLISYKLAERLLDEFKTISSICEASQKDLRKVKGIGKKKVEIIYQVLHDVCKKKPTNINNYYSYNNY